MPKKSRDVVKIQRAPFFEAMALPRMTPQNRLQLSADQIHLIHLLPPRQRIICDTLLFIFKNKSF
jgi:hypothetical protein